MTKSDELPFMATYEWVGMGWCSKHGYWRGPTYCPICPSYENEVRRWHDEHDQDVSFSRVVRPSRT